MNCSECHKNELDFRYGQRAPNWPRSLCRWLVCSTFSYWRILSSYFDNFVSIHRQRQVAVAPYLHLAAPKNGSFVFHRWNNLFGGNRCVCFESEIREREFNSNRILLVCSLVWFPIELNESWGRFFDFYCTSQFEFHRFRHENKWSQPIEDRHQPDECRSICLWRQTHRNVMRWALRTKYFLSSVLHRVRYKFVPFWV